MMNLNHSSSRALCQEREEQYSEYSGERNKGATQLMSEDERLQRGAEQGPLSPTERDRGT
jgi:hypothetical protein